MPPTISVAVYMMTSYISRSLHIAELPKCVNILFVTPSGLETSCFFQLAVLLEARLVSDTLVCDPMSSLSLPLSLFISCFSLVFHIDRDVTYIFCLPFTVSLNVFQGVVTLWMSSSFSCLISLQSFWSSLSRFMEVDSVCLEKLARIYSIIMAGCA